MANLFLCALSLPLLVGSVEESKNGSAVSYKDLNYKSTDAMLVKPFALTTSYKFPTAEQWKNLDFSVGKAELLSGSTSFQSGYLGSCSSAATHPKN